MPLSSRMLQYLTQHPDKLLQYQLTGQLPRTSRPDSPLIRLLEQINPHDRARMLGVRVAPDLGYAAVSEFHNAEQLYRWLKPREEVIGSTSWPAESRRYKSFNQCLTLDDLLRHTHTCPDDIRQRYEFLNQKLYR